MRTRRRPSRLTQCEPGAERGRRSESGRGQTDPAAARGSAASPHPDPSPRGEGNISRRRQLRLLVPGAAIPDPAVAYDIAIRLSATKQNDLIVSRIVSEAGTTQEKRRRHFAPRPYIA